MLDPENDKRVNINVLSICVLVVLKKDLMGDVHVRCLLKKIKEIPETPYSGKKKLFYVRDLKL